MLLLNRGLELERIHLHDRGDRDVLADEFAGLDQPFGDRAGDRRPDDGVGDLLLRQLVGGAPILQAGLQAVDGVERGLIVRLGDLQARLRAVAVGLRQQAAPAQLLRPLERAARVVTVRGRLAHRRNLVVGRRLLFLQVIDPELRFDLAEGALGAVERQLELARLQPGDHVAGPDLGAELHADVAHDAGDLAADACLLGGRQRPRQVHLALDRHPLDRGDLGRDGRAAPATPAAARAAAAGRARGLTRRLLAGRGERPRDR